jgi:hypothetical protein
VQGATCRASPRPASRAHFCSGRLHPTVRPAFPIHPSVRLAPVTSTCCFLSHPRRSVGQSNRSRSAWFSPARTSLPRFPIFTPYSSFCPYSVLASSSSKRGTVAGLTSVHRNCPVGSALVQIKDQTKLCTMLPKFTVCTYVYCVLKMLKCVKVRVEATSW